jgi:hypothetical protein
MLLTTALSATNIQIPKSSEEEDFDFSREMEKINSNKSVKLKNKELSKRFKQYVNPENDCGHCASCAFNTHLHFAGYKIKKAVNPNNYKKFGDWFYQKFSPRFEDVVLEAEKDETFGEFKKRVITKVTELTKPYQSVLISISDGAHWYTAYNDGKKIWFVDSQLGQGFNLYESETRKNDEPIDCSAVINIIAVSSEDVEDYTDKFPV